MGGKKKFLGLLGFLFFCAIGMWAVESYVQSLTAGLLGWAIFIACAWYLWSAENRTCPISMWNGGRV